MTDSFFFFFFFQMFLNSFRKEAGKRDLDVCTAINVTKENTHLKIKKLHCHKWVWFINNMEYYLVGRDKRKSVKG